MRIRLNHALLAYSAILTTALAGVAVTQAVSGPAKAAFDEIDVKRINVREEDGTLRMVVSNRTRAPGIIVRGKETPHPNRNTAGVRFFNDEGTESGGLTYAASTVDGKTYGTAHLAFDQYEQDQIVELFQNERNGRRNAGLLIGDRPDAPLPFAELERMRTLPPAEKEAARRKLIDSGVAGGTDRVFVGKTDDRASRVILKDAKGRDRLALSVSAEGAATIQFLDEAGKVVRTLTP